MQFCVSKITDNKPGRWEVPDTLVDLSHSRDDLLANKSEALYSVRVGQSSPFSLKIYHRDDPRTAL